MQAFYLHPDLIQIHLKSFNLDLKEAELFEKKAICRLIMLHDIPVSILPLLNKASKAYNLELLLSGKNCELADRFDAIIAAAQQDLVKLSEVLIDNQDEAARLGHIIRQELKRPLAKKSAELKLGDTSLPLGKRTLIMGILNVTPDSFSDGGRFEQLDKALAQAFTMAEEGADIIDVGGESTRPGHKQITAEEELSRVMPVINALKKDSSFKLPLSIDTYKADLAEQALDAGVEMLNDIWGLKADQKLGQIAASYGVPICLMHNRSNPVYKDLISEMVVDLRESIDLALRAGIKEKQIIIDPGIGFGKDVQQNLDVMLHLREFCSLGYPLLLGTSRKSMIGKTLDLPVEERLEGTAATVAYGISAGADIIRVHDVLAMRKTACMTDAMVRR